MFNSRKLILERLEDRITPVTWGIPWPNPSHLTLSFVPDGTAVSSYQSTLFQTMNAVASTSVWETAILQAYQTWAVNANINIGLVPDGGEPLGASGAIQGDSRFGDSRVALAPEPSNADAGDTSPFEYSGSTWDGDMVLNRAYSFGVNGTGQYDLFSVALHEAGHVFGFADETTDSTSANYAYYTGVRTGLSSGDISALQSLYGGPRSASTTGNNSQSKALALPQNGQTPYNGDINSLTQVDYYKFNSPAAAKGATTSSFTVQVQTQGLSLLEPSVTVYNDSGTAVGSAAASNPINNNVNVSIANAQPNATYYVKVTSATSSVFGIGSYQVSVPTSSSSSGSSGSSGPANNSFAAAQVLNSTQMVTNSQGCMFSVSANIATAGQGNYYKVGVPALPVSGTALLTVTAGSTDSLGLNPYIAVFASNQTPLSSTVINNGGGTYTVQMSGVSTGTTYFVEVSALAGATQNVGNYALELEFDHNTATSLQQLTSGSLTQSAAVSYAALSVTQSELTEFSLSASAGSSTVPCAVRMSIFDQNGDLVFTMVAYAGQPLSTGEVMLSAGVNYTICYDAATQTGAALPSLNWSMAAQGLSNPLAINPLNITLLGSGTGLTISSNNGSVGTLPIVNPYSPPAG